MLRKLKRFPVVMLHGSSKDTSTVREPSVRVFLLGHVNLARVVQVSRLVAILAQSLPMWDAHTELTSLSPPRTNSRSGKSGLFPARGQRCHRQRKARSSLSHVDGIAQKIAETRSVSGWPLREGDPIIAPPPFPLVLCIHLCAFTRACFC